MSAGTSRSLRLILLAVATLAATAVVDRAGPSAAGPVSGLQAEAAQISRQLVQEQLQVGGYQQQYQADAAAVENDTAAIATALSGITADVHRIAVDRRRLTGQVVSAYISPGSNGFASIFDERRGSELARKQYEQIAIGDITTSIAVLHNDERRLASSKAALEQRRANDRALLAQQAVLLQRSQAAQALIEGQQAQINGQLAVAVAQQQASQAAAVATAIRAATAASTKSSPGTPPAAAPGTAVTGAGGATSDPALNPFLQCVVQHESGGNYAAVSPDGRYMGAFQFSQSTWDQAARLAGLPALVGVPPNLATKADQDTLAVALYALDGQQPWYDPCRTA